MGLPRDSNGVSRLIHPFVLVVTAVLVVGYVYIAARLTSTAPDRAALAAAHAVLDESGAAWVPVAALAAVGVGALFTRRGPYVRRVDIPVEGLAPDLDGVRIVQISDLHAGPTMRRAYVQRVVDMTKALAPDLIALTGDIVDGSVSRLASRVAPLQALTSGDRAFFVLGNHDYYSGAAPWTEHFEAMGFRVLENAHVTIARGAARLLIGGVIDFAARMSDPDARPRPDLATDGDAQPAFRLLLAHNPKIAPLAEQAGFDLQLSGHTRGPVLPVDDRDPLGPRAARGAGRGSATTQATRQARITTLYQEVMAITRAVVRDADAMLSNLPRFRGHRNAQRRAQLEQMVGLVRRVLTQTRARIVKGETHHPDKVLSVFEPQTEVIRKGKAAKPTEFGKVVKIQEAEGQITTDYQVCPTRVPDKALWVPALERHHILFWPRAAPGRRRCGLRLGGQRTRGARARRHARGLAAARSAEGARLRAAAPAVVSPRIAVAHGERRADQCGEAPSRAAPVSLSRRGRDGTLGRPRDHREQPARARPRGPHVTRRRCDAMTAGQGGKVCIAPRVKPPRVRQSLRAATHFAPESS